MTDSRLSQVRISSLLFGVVSPVARQAYSNVLTGVNWAFTKSLRADGLGSKAGFSGGHAWHENLDRPGEYLGVKFFKEKLSNFGGPAVYSALYRRMVQEASATAVLPSTDL